MINVFFEISSKVKAQLNYIIKHNKGDIEGSNKCLEVVKKVDLYLISINPPKDFSSSPDSVINQMDVSFENLCASLEEAGVSRPKKLSVFEFNQRIAYYQEKAKNNKAEEIH